MTETAAVERFMALFRGNSRSYGVYMPTARVKMVTVKAEFSAEHIRSHLDGEQGIGVVPIMDDATCVFAAIDIDVHGPAGSPHVDIMAIEQKITRNNIPLVACRSKSGGVHCYLFLREPTDCGRVRVLMARWAGQLGYGGAEIFPKQMTLHKQPGDSEQPLGNWINLPYFNAVESDRYAIDGGRQVTLEYFLELAEGRRTDVSEHEKGTNVDYLDGPPCLETMVAHKVDEGSRNTAAFQAAVYLKRAYPEDWRMRLDSFNRLAFVDALGQRELRQITGSVSKKDYQYKCREEPCRSLCQKDLCRTRAFGITASDATANEIPLIDNVEKVIATPIRWALTIQSKLIEVTTAELFNYEVVRQRVGEKLHIVLPRIKATEWDHYLREIMTRVTVREEMTLEDLIFQRLCEFLRRAVPNKNRGEDERREDLKRGMPALISMGMAPSFVGGKIVENDARTWYYAFRLTDFIEYMRRKKALPVPDHQIATYLYRVLGEDAKRDRVRVGKAGRIGNVWCVEEDKIENEEIPTKEFKTEF